MRTEKDRTNTANVQFRWQTDTNSDLVNGHQWQRNNNTDREWGQFTLVRGRNDSTTFLPISQGWGRNKSLTSRNRDCLTPRQTNFIYKKVELGSLINKNKVKEELDADAELDRMDDNNGDEKPIQRFSG